MGNKAITTATLALMMAVLTGTACLGQETTSAFAVMNQERFCAGLERGVKIRVRFTPGFDGAGVAADSGAQLEVGELESCTGGNLVIKPERRSRPPMQIPLESVENVQVRRKKPGHTMEGAVLGLLVGLVVSFAAQSNDHQDEWLGGLQDMEENINRGVGITIGTTLLGAVIGSAAGGEYWEDVAGYDRGAVSVSGARGGVGLTLACSF